MTFDTTVPSSWEFLVNEDTELTGNNPRVIWFTGLSGSGKSTIANELSKELKNCQKPHYILDGDNLRFGLNRDLGFTEADRTENIRRTAETAKLMADAGLIVLVTLISPKEADRQMAKEIIGDELFTLVYVDTPLEVCEQRDPKGFIKKQGLERFRTSRVLVLSLRSQSVQITCCHGSKTRRI